MKYFKNVEVARIYHVSEKSVRNWVDAALRGKLELDVYEHNGKHYVANTVKNQAAITKLVERGQKYKNMRGQKTVSARPEFYTLYSPKQIFDILSNLDIHREIPLQYTYIDAGADHWDQYAQRLFNEGTRNTITATIRLIEESYPQLDELLANSDKVNMVDLGVGNALPVRNLAQHLINAGLLRRYIGIDISEAMLKIATRNLQDWLGTQISFESYLKDFNYDRFEHVIAEDAFDHGPMKTTNLVLLLGGTLSNMQRPSRVLQLVKDSMCRNDLFLYSLKLDSESSRRYFNIRTRQQNRKFNEQLAYVLELLGIQETDYDFEQIYDDQMRTRFVQIIPYSDITIQFNIGEKSRSITLNRDERITVWRARHQRTLDVIQELDANGFDLLHASTTPDQEYLLTISKIKTPNTGH